MWLLVFQARSHTACEPQKEGAPKHETSEHLWSVVRRAVAEHSVSGKSGYNQTLETASALQALADILPVHQIPPRLDVVSLDVQVI